MCTIVHHVLQIRNAALTILEAHKLVMMGLFGKSKAADPKVCFSCQVTPTFDFERPYLRPSVKIGAFLGIVTAIQRQLLSIRLSPLFCYASKQSSAQLCAFVTSSAPARLSVRCDTVS